VKGRERENERKLRVRECERVRVRELDIPTSLNETLQIVRVDHVLVRLYV